MPLSVEMPAPVRTTIASASSIHLRVVSKSSKLTDVPLPLHATSLLGGIHMLVAVHDAPETLTVRPWPDSVLDEVGHDPRSPYVERFWLGVLGPSSVVFLRRVAAELEANPAGFELPLAETARALGLGMKGGRNSPFLRTINRCVQ